MTSYGLKKWFWAIFEPTWTWPNLTFGQLFTWVGTNNDHIWPIAGKYLFVYGLLFAGKNPLYICWSPYCWLVFICIWSPYCGKKPFAYILVPLLLASIYLYMVSLLLGKKTFVYILVPLLLASLYFLYGLLIAEKNPLYIYWSPYCCQVFIFIWYPYCWKKTFVYIYIGPPIAAKYSC